MQTQSYQNFLTCNEPISEQRKKEPKSLEDNLQLQSLIREESSRVHLEPMLTRNKASRLFGRIVFDGSLQNGIVCCFKCSKILAYPSAQMASSNLVRHIVRCPGRKEHWDIEFNDIHRRKLKLKRRHDLESRSKRRALRLYDVNSNDSNWQAHSSLTFSSQILIQQFTLIKTCCCC